MNRRGFLMGLLAAIGLGPKIAALRAMPTTWSASGTAFGIALRATPSIAVGLHERGAVEEFFRVQKHFSEIQYLTDDEFNRVRNRYPKTGDLLD